MAEEVLESNTVHKNLKRDVSLKDDEILIAEVSCGAMFRRTWYKEGLPKLKKAEDIFFNVREVGIEVWAEDYVHVVEIEGADHLSDNYFSLIPGEKRFIHWDKAETKQNISVLGYTFMKGK